MMRTRFSRLLSLLTALMMIMGMFPDTALAGTYVSGSGTLKLTGSGEIYGLYISFRDENGSPANGNVTGNYYLLGRATAQDQNNYAVDVYWYHQLTSLDSISISDFQNYSDNLCFHSAFGMPYYTVRNAQIGIYEAEGINSPGAVESFFSTGPQESQNIGEYRIIASRSSTESYKLNCTYTVAKQVQAETGAVKVTKAFSGITAAQKPVNFQIANNYNDTVFTYANADNADTADGISTPYEWTISDVPVGTTITFTESNEGVANYTLADTSVKVKTSEAVVKDETKTVTFTNAYTQDTGSVKVTKAFSGITAAQKPGNFQIVNNYNDTVFTYANARNAATADGITDPYEWMIRDVPVGTTITFTESNEGVTNYSLADTSAKEKTSGAVVKGETQTVAFMNTYTQDTGSVKVTKAFSGITAAQKPENFQITNNYNDTVFTYANARNAATVDGITDPYEWMIREVPVGTIITFTESNEGVTNYSLADTSVKEKTSEAVVKGETKTVAFTNTYTQDTGSVKVTKAFSGITAAQKPGSFQITNDYKSTIFTYSNADNTTTADGISTPYEWTIENVPVGTTITFTESNEGVTNYTLAATSVKEKTSEAVVKDETKVVAFTNTYMQDTGSVKVTKTFSGITAAQKPGSFQITNNYNDTVFTYANADNADTADGINTPYEWTISDVPVGTSITFTESNEGVTNYTLADTSAKVKTSEVVTKDETRTVVFTNTYIQDVGSVKVTKGFSGITAAQKPGNFQIANNYNDSMFTYANADNATTADGISTPYEWTINVVPVGTTITFTESGEGVTNYTLADTSVKVKTSEAVVKDGTQTVAFTNAYTQDTGSVKVTKAFSGITAAQKPGNFQITNDYNSTVFTYSNADNATIADGITTPYEWTIENVPVGTTITFTESGEGVTNYTLADTSAKVKTSEAVVKDETQTVAFTNTYTQDVGSIKVTKAFSGITAAQKPANFQIANNYNDSVFTYANADNAATADGISIPYEWTISNVPVGTTITFTESGEGIPNYTLAVTSVKEKTSEAVVKDETQTVAFTNAYTQDTGSVKVTKAFSGITAAQKPGSFQITNDYNSTIFTYSNADNAATADGISTPYEWTIENVPVGTTITFTESNEGVTNYTLADTSVKEKTSEAVVKGETKTVAFTNTYTQDTGSVKVTKVFSGITAAQKPGDFQITNDYNSTIFTYSNADNATTADGISTPYEWTIENVPVGTTITFTESGESVANYTLADTSVKVKTSEAVEKGETKTVAFTNAYTRDTGLVKVTKAFSGITVAQKPANFQIANNYNDSVFTYANADNAATADGISIPYEWTISNVPVGITITFTESNEGVTNYSLADTSAKVKTSEVVLKDETQTVAFTNTYTQDTGSVKVTKAFSGITAAQKPGNFQITNNYNDTVFTYANARNAATADGINNSYEWTINDVPVGTTITFTESGEGITNYTLADTSMKVKTSEAVEKGETKTVAFTNAYTQDVGSVKVTKAFSGIAAAQKPGTFQITNDYNSTIFTYSNADNATTADGISSPYEWTISDVPVGTTITFTESGEGVANYTLAETSAKEKTSEAVVKDETKTVAFTNAYTQDTGLVKVMKVFSGITAAQKPVNFQIANNYNDTVFTYANADNADAADGISTPYEWTINVVPVGTTITFTESGEGVTNYTLADTSVKVKTSEAVVKDETKTVAFMNTYTQDTGSVNVTKVFSGITAAQKPGDFQITNDYNSTIFTYSNADNATTADGISTPYEWTISNVPVGTAITFTESNMDVLNYTLEATTVPENRTSEAVVKDGTQTVAFTNTYTQDTGSVKVTKAFSGITAAQKPGSFQITNDYNSTIFTYSNADNATTADGISTPYEWTIRDVPVGTTITFTESGEGVTNYTLADSSVKEKTSEAVVKDETKTVAFTNTYTQDTGSVKVTKAFSGITAAQKPGSFQITNDYNSTIFTYINADNATTVDGISAAYEWTIGNVPVGTTITFTESGEGVTNYTLADTSVKEKTSEAVVKDETQTVAFTNAYIQDVGAVKVTKAFSGITAAQKPANFQIANNYNDSVFTYANADNAATADGIGTPYEWTIENVPVGTIITFTESGEGVTNYTLADTSVKVKTSEAVVKDETKVVVFTNAYTQDVGSVKVTKAFSGITAAQKPENFQITNNYNDSVFTYANADNAAAADGISSPYEWTIENVPVWTTITFTESGEGVTNYTLADTSEKVKTSEVVTKDEARTVAFTNTYTQDVGSVKVTKAFSGITAAQKPGNFQITNDYNSTIFTYSNADNATTADGISTPYEWTISNVPVGTAITFTESGESVANYTLADTSVKVKTSEAVEKGETKTVAFTNAYTRDTGSVKVSKAFSGIRAVQKPANFQIANNYNDSVFTYANADNADTADGISIPYEWTISNVPAGITITFTESGEGITNYTLADTSMKVKTSEAVVKDETKTVVFTNTYTQDTGSVKVTKAFSGITAAQKPGNFQITNDYNSTIFTYSNADNADAADGISTPYEWMISDVPAGTTITFTESGEEVAKYNLTAASLKTRSSEAVEKDKVTQTDFINVYEPQQGSLTISKIWAGDHGRLTEEQKKAAVFTVTGPEGYIETFTFADMTNGSRTLEHLVPGEYTLTETNAEYTGFTASAKYETGGDETNKATVTDGGAVTVTVTNTLTYETAGSIPTQTSASAPTATPTPTPTPASTSTPTPTPTPTPTSRPADQLPTKSTSNGTTVYQTPKNDQGRTVYTDPEDLPETISESTGDFSLTEMFGSGTGSTDSYELIHGYSPMKRDLTQGEYVPDPAVVREMQVRDTDQGSRVYTLTLAEDLYYSDGTPITAWDYAFSLLLMMAPEVEQIGGKISRPTAIRGYEEYFSYRQARMKGETEEELNRPENQGKYSRCLPGVRVLSDHQLEITLDRSLLPLFSEDALLLCEPWPIYVLAPGCRVYDDGDGVYIGNADQTVTEPLFTPELLAKTILDEETGYNSHPFVVSGPYAMLSYENGISHFVRNPFFKGAWSPDSIGANHPAMQFRNNGQALDIQGKVMYLLIPQPESTGFPPAH